MSILLALSIAGCATPSETPLDDGNDAPRPTSGGTTTQTPARDEACGSGTVAGSPSYQFVRAYVEQDVPYEGEPVGDFLRVNHSFRSWTDMRIVAFRNASFTGEPGIEIATVDATNGSTTWRLQLDYSVPARCVADRSADDERLCEHWTGAADAFVTSFNEIGGWSALGSSDCQPARGG